MKTSVTLQKDYEHEHVMVSVINMTDVCVSGVGVWNPSRDGSEGDQLQLEEDHQQHQGDLRLQGGSGIVSMERFMEFAVILWRDTEVSWVRNQLKVFLRAWALLPDQELYFSEETHASVPETQINGLRTRGHFYQWSRSSYWETPGGSV